MIRNANLTARYCVVVWTDLQTYQVAQVQNKAMGCDVALSPIEKKRKQIKRIISLQRLIISQAILASLIQESFLQIAASLPFDRQWVQDFILPVFNHYPISQ